MIEATLQSLHLISGCFYALLIPLPTRPPQRNHSDTL
jgi:hypothetical protein